MREIKDSNISWIGAIPDTWSLNRLGNCLIEIKHINNPPKTSQVLSLLKDKGVVLYEDKGDIGNKAKNDITGYKLAYPDTLVVNSMNILIGSVGISPYMGCVSPVYYVFKEAKDIDLRYINYIFNTREFQKELRKYANGILEIRLRVSTDDILKRLVPFPTLTEQTAIANEIDKACSEIDFLISDIQSQIDTLEQYKKSVITEAVTKGLNPNVEMKDSGIGWIRDIPSNWDIARISNIYAESSATGRNGLPILTVSIKDGVSDCELSEDESLRTFIRIEDRSKYKHVIPGDLAYNMMRAWQGALGAVRVEGMISPAYVVARPKAELDSRYMEYLIRTPSGIEEMHRYSYGVADFRLRLYWSQFKNIKVCIPPYSEQIAIADYLDSKCTEISSIIDSKNEQIEILETYKKSLIYEYVTGKKEVAYA